MELNVKLLFDSRQLMLPEIAEKVQQQLLQAKVLIVGAGISSMAAMYLLGLALVV